MKKKMLIVVALCMVFLSGCDLTGKQVQDLATETDAVAGQVSDVATAVVGAPLTGEQVEDVISQIRAGNAVTAPWNPYSPIIDLGLLLVSSILGVKIAKKTSEAKIAAKTLGAVVGAVEDAKNVKDIKPNVGRNLSYREISIEGRDLITIAKDTSY